MKKIGIMTLCRAENYGAVLQSFALDKFLNSEFGHAEIIDFTPHFLVNRYSYWNIDSSSFIGSAVSVVWSLFKLPVRVKKRYRFEKFRRNKCHYSKRQYLVEYVGDEYDYYIVGSDQVFNMTLSNDDLEFFLPRIECKKSTYAASIGVSELSEDQKKVFIKYLPQFSNISIREYQGCNMIKELLPGKEIVQLIDPVFLIDQELWLTYIGYRRVKKKYILIYAFKGYRDSYSIAKKISNGHKIIYINDYFAKTDADVIDIYGMGPLEFLNLIYYADYVITDSFHGVAFSIIFNKDFYAIPYPGTESRILDVLGIFDLQMRVCLRNDYLDRTLIDYNKVDVKIKECQVESYKYLERVLASI